MRNVIIRSLVIPAAFYISIWLIWPTCQALATEVYLPDPTSESALATTAIEAGTLYNISADFSSTIQGNRGWYYRGWGPQLGWIQLSNNIVPSSWIWNTWLIVRQYGDGQIMMHPQMSNAAVVQWVVPQSGVYHINFSALDGDAGGSGDGVITTLYLTPNSQSSPVSGGVFHSASLDAHAGRPSTAWSGTTYLQAGMTVSAYVDPKANNWQDTTVVGLTLQQVSPPPSPRLMDIVSTADDQYKLYIDGVLVSQDDGLSWPTAEYASVLLTPGEHVIGVDAWDTGGLIAAFLATFRINGEIVFNTDSNWKVNSLTPTNDWKAVNFDDSDWVWATEIPQSRYVDWSYPAGRSWPVSGLDTENAHWIWTSGFDGPSDQRVYMRYTFTVVPEAGTVVPLVAALGGLAAAARRKWRVERRK